MRLLRLVIGLVALPALLLAAPLLMLAMVGRWAWTGSTTVPPPRQPTSTATTLTGFEARWVEAQVLAAKRRAERN